MIGIRQQCLLRRCALKGHLSVSDVLRYYHFKGSDKCFGILEKLELLGYLRDESENRYILTARGKNFVKDMLKNDRGVD